ncbi:hypothetical protein FRC02_010308 [Tulasnella sp. 418]|nr:hypothetical protein FRC02_010308 [Tulasnella sp. 418]
MSSLASRLSSLFPGSSDTHFLSLFHDPKFQSPSKALRHDLTRRGSSWTMTPIFDETLFSFLGILGIEDNEEEGFEDASLCLRASEENIGIALDLMLLLQEMDAEGLVRHSSPSSPTSPTMQPPILAINHLKSETQSARKISYAESSKGAISEDHWTRVRRPQKQVSRKPEETQNVTTQPGPSGSRVQEPSESDEDLSEEECRYWAQYYRSKREEMLSSASQHWKRGPHAKGGEIAQYYAEESRSYDRKSREWALKAARAMVSNQKTTVNGPSVDLHGLTLHEALTIVREKVNEWWNSAGAGGVPSRHLTIITGVGNHSANRKAVLAPAVYNALTRDGWRVTKKPGQLHVTGLERSATGRANR